MIVYNVKRRWFTHKLDAEAYRRAEGLPVSANLKLEVGDREGLAALLNALCEPGNAQPTVEVPAPLIDRAFVSPSINVPDYVPRFLLDAVGKAEWDARHKGERK